MGEPRQNTAHPIKETRKLADRVIKIIKGIEKDKKLNLLEKEMADYQRKIREMESNGGSNEELTERRRVILQELEKLDKAKKTTAFQAGLPTIDTLKFNTALQTIKNLITQ